MINEYREICLKRLSDIKKEILFIELEIKKLELIDQKQIKMFVCDSNGVYKPADLLSNDRDPYELT